MKNLMLGLGRYKGLSIGNIIYMLRKQNYNEVLCESVKKMPIDGRMHSLIVLFAKQTFIDNLYYSHLSEEYGPLLESQHVDPRVVQDFSDMPVNLSNEGGIFYEF